MHNTTRRLLYGLHGLAVCALLACRRENPAATIQPAKSPSAPAAIVAPQGQAESRDPPAPLTHELADGETLWDVARSYGLSMEQLLQQNGLTEAAARKLRPGRALTLTGATRCPPPSTPSPRRDATKPLAPLRDGAYHYLREGESLWTLARLYDVSPDALLASNGLREEDQGRLQIGQAIAIPGLTATQSQSSEPLRARASEARERRGYTHEIARGETVWDIAHTFGVSVAEIMAANALDAESVQNIHEGQKLILPGVQDDGGGHTHKLLSGHEKRAAMTASNLGLGGLEVAGKLLHGRVEPRWIAAAGGVRSLVGTLRWPVAQGWFVRGFGSGQGGYHKAMDIMGKIGWNVRAAAPGIVGYSGDKVPGFGNMIMVVHPGGWVTLYAHNSVNFVSAGERVQQGAVLAEVGSTGRSTGPHVHFELIYRGENCDPAPLFRPGVRHRSGKFSSLAYTSWLKPDKRPKSVQCAVRQKHPEPVLQEDPAIDAQPVDDRELRDSAPDDAFANLVRDLATP